MDLHRQDWMVTKVRSVAIIYTPTSPKPEGGASGQQRDQKHARICLLRCETELALPGQTVTSVLYSYSLRSWASTFSAIWVKRSLLMWFKEIHFALQMCLQVVKMGFPNIAGVTSMKEITKTPPEFKFRWCILHFLLFLITAYSMYLFTVTIHITISVCG